MSNQQCQSTERIVLPPLKMYVEGKNGLVKAQQEKPEQCKLGLPLWFLNGPVAPNYECLDTPLLLETKSDKRK